MMKGNKYHVLGDKEGNIMYKLEKKIIFHYISKEFSIKTELLKAQLMLMGIQLFHCKSIILQYYLQVYFF